jgi:UDP:flavonoid glycosyltransferase YjiC (YdhE family)
MRMLFVASALPTHFHTMAPFAWAARAAGHDVCVATQPALCDAISASGLATVVVGAPMDFAGDYRAGRKSDPKSLYADIAADMSDDLIGFARRWRADVVVWEPTSFAGPLAAAASGAKSWRFLWGPDIVGRGGSGLDRMPEQVLGLFDKYGVTVDDVSPGLTIDPCPPSVQLPTTVPWRHIRYVPHSTAGRVHPGLLALPARPRIVVTLGTSVTALVGDQAFLAPTVARALGSLDADVFVALPSGQVAAFGELPDNTRIVSDCPLHVLLSGAAAFVNHGGAGTILSGIHTGVPQLILSAMPDLRFNGDRLAGTGAGLRLDAADMDDAAIRDAAIALTYRQDYAVAAAKLRDEAASQPTPAALVSELADLPEDMRSYR